MLNKVTIMGRLTREPDFRTTPGGTPFVNFTLAVKRDKKDKNGERQTDFIDVIAWRSMAEYVRRYFHKGQPAVVEGRIRTSSYTDADGIRRKSFEVYMDLIYFAGGDSKSGEPEPEDTDLPEFSSEEFADTDLPF